MLEMLRDAIINGQLYSDNMQSDKLPIPTSASIIDSDSNFS